MELKRIAKIKILFLLILFNFPCFAFAEYFGPVTIINEMWGGEIDKIGFKPEDSGDTFTRLIRINKVGYCFIADMLNKRIKIYKPNSKVFSIITPQKVKIKYTWPDFMDCDSRGNVYTSNYDKKLQKYDIKGNLLWEKELSIGAIYVQSDDSIMVWGYRLDHQEETCLHYSSTGQLLKAYDTKPLELGIVQEISSGGGNYENIIEYPDKKWKVKGLCAKYMLDACETLYCVDNAIVIRYDDEGKDVAFVGMPDEKIEQLPNPNPPGSGVDAPTKVIEQYGSPVLAPNGDVYTWKRTPDKYSILKWVWVDGPGCPQYLEVKSTVNSLKFTWQKPTKDADKVTGYQLLQSYNICGPFRQTALLKKDQLSYEDRDVKKGETYYYVVKAVRDKEYSGNSNKVCGQVE